MSLSASERYVERTCSLCGTKFHDSTPTYCRVCTNQYYAWRQRQKRAGLPTTITEYRRVMDKPHPRWPLHTSAPEGPEAVRYKECPICLGVHSHRHSVYCPKCKAWYQTWARKQRELYALSNGVAGEARPTVELFRNMVYDAQQRRT